MFYSFSSVQNAVQSSRVKSLEFLTDEVSAQNEENPNKLSLATGNKPKKNIPNIFWSDDSDRLLFDNKSDIKVLISKIGMHLKPEFRTNLFQQIDRLLDLDSFCDGDQLIQASSFASLLSFLLAYPHARKPSLTVGNRGQIYGTWVAETGKLHIEFLPMNIYRAMASKADGENKEFFSHTGSHNSSIKFLRNNDLETWITNNG